PSCSATQRSIAPVSEKEGSTLTCMPTLPTTSTMAPPLTQAEDVCYLRRRRPNPRSIPFIIAEKSRHVIAHHHEVRSFAHLLPPYRRRAHRAVQLALCQ